MTIEPAEPGYHGGAERITSKRRYAKSDPKDHSYLVPLRKAKVLEIEVEELPEGEQPEYEVFDVFEVEAVVGGKVHKDGTVLERGEVVTILVTADQEQSYAAAMDNAVEAGVVYGEDDADDQEVEE